MTDAVARLLQWAEQRPDELLLVTRDHAYSYGDFTRRAGLVAAGLVAAGGERGQRVALCLEEYDEFFICLMGAWLAGMVVVPLNTSLPPADVERLIDKAGSDLLVVPACGCGPAAGVPRLALAVDDDGGVAGLRRADDSDALISSDQAQTTPRSGSAPAEPPLASPAPSPPQPIGEDDLAMIMFTSGTTGLPKGACQTLRAISSNAGHVALTLGLGGDDRIFINTPPYFTSGICHFLTLMANGGGIAGHLGFYFGDELLLEMERLGCTGFGGAPAHLVRVVEPLVAPRAHSFRFWVSSGDHLPAAVIAKLNHVLPGVELFNIYGLTEVSGRLCILPPAALAERVGSVGRPIGDMRVVARDAAGEVAPAGESGELYVTGSLLMQGYLDEPEITARTLTPLGFCTGDFGHVDGDGYVWIEGRKDDIIKRGGEKVSLVHVQQAIAGLERFADVAVLAAPDEILGHVPVAFVVPREEGVKASRVLRELRAVLPPSRCPAVSSSSTPYRAPAPARSSAPSWRRCSPRSWRERLRQRAPRPQPARSRGGRAPAHSGAAWHAGFLYERRLDGDPAQVLDPQ